MANEQIENNLDIKKLAEEAKIDISKYNEKEVELGFKKEQEHKDIVKEDKDILKLVIEHLDEDANYYSKLEEMLVKEEVKVENKMENKVEDKLEKYKDAVLNSITFDSDIKKVNEIYHGVMSSSYTNLQGQAVNPLGMDLSIINHSKMLLWNHNPNAPMGIVNEIRMDKEYSYVDFDLLDSDQSPCADAPSPNMIRKLIAQGVKFGISPGYYATEQRKPTGKDKEIFGDNVNIVISKSLPTEISLCVQPANLSAYMNAMNNSLNELNKTILPTDIVKVDNSVAEVDEETEIRKVVRNELLKRRGVIYV